MSERKNIDRLFQEKFKDFETAPSDKVWEKIAAELQEKKQKKVIPIWYKVAGVAAVLLFGFVITDGVISYKSNEIQVVNGAGTDAGKKETQPKIDLKQEIHFEQQVVTEAATGETFKEDTEEARTGTTGSGIVHQGVQPDGVQKKGRKTVGNGTTSQSQIFEAVAGTSEPARFGNSKAGSFTDPKNNVAVESGWQKNQNRKKSTLFSEKNLLKSDDPSSNYRNVNRFNEAASGSYSKNYNLASREMGSKTASKKDSATVGIVTNPLELLLKEKENTEKGAKVLAEVKPEKWQIRPNVAPVYMNSASKGSPIDAEFSDNSKSYESTMSYGIGVDYAINKKLTVRTGINQVAMGYNTNDIVYYADFSGNGMKNLNLNGDNSKIVVTNQIASDPELFSAKETSDGYLNQKMGYLEVPMEISYKLIDRRFAVELIGGMSTLFLNDNKVSLYSEGRNANLGEANNLNTVHFSTNVGLGFKYSFLKSFEASFEPMLKYQLNTFSESSGNFKPYFIGLYTGVSFRF